MNWLKKNPIPAAIAVVAVLGTAGTGFLAVQELARHEQAITDFNSQATTIRRLQAMQPYPDPANLRKVEESVKAYEAAFLGFLEQLNKMEAPAVDVTPQIFQDNLRQAVDDIRKLAAQKKVALPEKFFFGFEDYQTQLPAQDETKKLNREFQVIRNLVETIVPLGIRGIDSLVRHSGAEGKGKPADSKAAPPRAIPFDSFTLGITAPQGSFIAAFDKIPESPGILVVRSMTIENSNPSPPTKAPAGPAVTPNTGTAPGAKADKGDKLPMIFGNELVKATILFEIPDYPDKPTQPANQPPPGKK